MGAYFQTKGGLFLPNTGASKTVVLHGFEYYGEDGMIIIRNTSTGETREVTPNKALYVASEMHKAMVGKNKSVGEFGKVDAAQRRVWDRALEQIYALAEEQRKVAAKAVDEATSARSTRGRFGHLLRRKNKRK